MTVDVVTFDQALPAMLADLQELVTTESPSHDLTAMRRSARLVRDMGQRVMGQAPEVFENDTTTHLLWTFGEGTPRTLAVGHHDTVWPLGSLGSTPWSIEAGRLTGPGCFDMKTGVVMAFHAIAALGDPSGVAVLITGDEETGSRTSRDLIETVASGCDSVLVLEGAGPGGALKTRRKGAATYSVVVTGKAAHAGLNPQDGVNATVAVSHVIHDVLALGDAARGTTVVPTTVTSGTTTNTVPASATLDIDVRVADAAELRRVRHQLQRLVPRVPGAVLDVIVRPERPPLGPEHSGALFELATQLNAELGGESLQQASVGGVSDGNLTAGLGVPTLDGLGAVGGGAHADDEHVIVSTIPHRTALIASLLDTLRTGFDGSVQDPPTQ